MTDPSAPATQPSVDYKARRADRQSSLRQQRQSKKPYFIVGSVLLVILLLLGAEYGLSWKKIHTGISVGPLNLGGMTQPQASQAIEDYLSPAKKRAVTFIHKSESVKISANDAGFSYDAKAMAADAYNVGRSDNIATDFAQRINAYFGKSLPLKTMVSDESVRAISEPAAKKIDIAPVDASIKIEGGKFVAKEGSDGIRLQVAQIISQLPGLLVEGTEEVPAPIMQVKHAIDLDSANQTIVELNPLVDEPILLEYQKKSWNLDAQVLATVYSFKRSDDLSDKDVALESKRLSDATSSNPILVPIVDTTKIAQIVIPMMGAAVGSPPVDAKFTTAGGQVNIIPSKDGTGADPNALALDILETSASEITPKVVVVNTTTVKPKVTTELAKEMGIAERISRYTTTFSSGNRPRVANIQLLAKSLDGTLIAPGGTFSFNETIGQRTAEKGYQEAGAIVDGVLVNQLGGGICQVNTTLFNAVLESGLPVKQRRNHSYYISHYPLGRDATVSWGGPDFKFVNDLDTWVLISTSTTNGSVTISIYGTDPGYNVTLSTSGWTNIRGFSTTEIKDPTLKKGTRIVEDKGVSGGKVTVTRVVKKDGEIVSKSTFPSTYTPKTEVVRVGTRVDTSKKVTTPPTE